MYISNGKKIRPKNFERRNCVKQKQYPSNIFKICSVTSVIKTQVVVLVTFLDNVFLAKYDARGGDKKKSRYFLEKLM